MQWPGGPVCLAVTAVDGHGHPIPDATVGLSVASGDGALQPLIVAKDAGISFAAYTPGAASGYTRFIAKSGTITREAIIYQNGSQELKRIVGSVGSDSETQQSNTLRSKVTLFEITQPNVTPVEMSTETVSSAGNTPNSNETAPQNLFV